MPEETTPTGPTSWKEIFRSIQAVPDNESIFELTYEDDSSVEERILNEVRTLISKNKKVTITSEMKRLNLEGKIYGMCLEAHGRNMFLEAHKDHDDKSSMW